MSVRAAKVVLEWEGKELLSDLQRQSIIALQEISSDLPIPPIFDKEDDLDLGSVGPEGEPQKQEKVLEISGVIENSQQFFNWYADIESSMERGREDVYRSYLQEVHCYRNACGDIISRIDHTLSLLNELETNFESVSKKSSTLQEACEKLLEEQTHLVNLAENIGAKLAYFNELEVISKVFDTPGEIVVLSEPFVPMLARLDECLEYVQAHLKYKDSELFVMKFRHCMTRGLTLIKMYFVDTLQATVKEILQKIQTEKTAEDLTEASETALFYVKFRTFAPRLKALVAEIEKRSRSRREFLSLMDDCYSAYFTSRETLLGRIIQAKILSLSRNDDLISFAKAGCSFVMRICADEYQLFQHFFPASGSDNVHVLLGNLSNYFHEAMRPRIIRESSFQQLANLCEVFFSQILRQSNDADAERVAYQAAMTNILEDVQNKLIFRAQAYVASQVEGFAPKPHDLDYPNKLVKETTPEKAEVGLARSLILVSDHNVQDLTEKHKDWYPTLTHTLWVLSKLYRCVNTKIFEDISEDIVSACYHSLVSASQAISKKSKVDGQLFLIKHLLILREQIAPFEANFLHTENAINFEHLRSEAEALIKKGKIWSFSRENPLWSFVQEGIPSSMVVTTRDSKKQVDEALKKACEEFISAAVKDSTDPISSFLVKAAAFKVRQTQGQEQPSLSSQPFAQPDQVKGLVDALAKQLEKVIPPHLAHIRKYLNDQDTEEVLFKAIKAGIANTYKQFYELVRGNYENRLVAQVWSGHDIKKRLDALSASVAASPASTPIKTEAESGERPAASFRLGESPPMTPSEPNTPVQTKTPSPVHEESLK